MLPGQPAVRVHGDLPLSLTGIARALGFYLFLVFVVFFLSLTGMYLSYIIIILVSLLFILAAKVTVRSGNPLPGAVTGTLAITATFGLMLAVGTTAIAGLETGIVDALLIGILMQTFVAVGEELSFRGYLLGDLRAQLGLPAAIALSSLGFAFLHVHSMLLTGINPPSALIALVTITAAGAVLALLTIRWGILSAMGFHFAWNFFQYNVFGLGLAGEFDSVLKLSGPGDILLTGGEYGPEASLPGLFVILITLGVAWYLCRRHKTDNCHTR